MPNTRPSSDPLRAYDEAMAAIQNGDRSAATYKQAVLALARGGATETALKAYQTYGLDQLTDDEDALSLKGRLLKDLIKRQDTHAEAAAAYQRAYNLTGGTYSGINAATLYTLSGDKAQGAALARAVLNARPSTSAGEQGEAAYYARATEAEALLLLKEISDAREALGQAVLADPENYIAHAATLRQFEKILSAFGEPRHWLDDYRPPQVAFYAGRIQAVSETGTKASAELESIIRKELVNARVSTIYGALAAGADILIAEALIEDGAALNVVLPCEIETFIEHSVKPFGGDWPRRFHSCLEAADSISIATTDTSLMGRTAIEFAAEIAMGRALKHASDLATSALQILLTANGSDLVHSFETLWGSARGAPETLRIAERWKPTDVRKSGTLNTETRKGHQLGAMIFADLKGYSALTDAQVSDVVGHILGPLSDTLNSSIPPLYVNSWGDGIFAIYKQVSDAANAALSLQAAMRKIDKASLGLPQTLDLRIGGHYGPLTLMPDPVTGRQGAYGSQVSYAARIEPIAVPGSILVSEAFAARLGLSSASDAETAYVGMRQLKPNGPDVRLFALRPQ